MLSAGEVYAAFEADPAAAGRRYVGQRIRVRGQLGSYSVLGYSTTAPPEARITKADAWLRAPERRGQCHLKCFFTSREGNPLGNARSGEEAVIEGVCAGVETPPKDEDRPPGVTFEDCRLVWSSGPKPPMPFDRSTCTRRQFVDKMKDMIGMGRGGSGQVEQETFGKPFTFAQYNYMVFMDTFGQPTAGFDGNFAFNDAQTWFYRCSDGVVRLSVTCGPPIFRDGRFVYGKAGEVVVRDLGY
ncbi:MAG: hypothetical protein K2X87_09745 [Gemmataceae bacterium]|nr:hypothetical protein [Gemmataceae bacterium]